MARGEPIVRPTKINTSFLDLPISKLLSTIIYMPFPKELSQVSLIRELYFVV